MNSLGAAIATREKPMPVKISLPDFRQWLQDSFEVDGLTGQPSDSALIYDEIAKRKGPPDRNAARRYLRDNGLSPHHQQDGQTIQLIPSDLHSNVPHIGGAALLRRGSG